MSETYCTAPHDTPRKADRGELCWGHIKQLARKGKLTTLKKPQGGVVGSTYASRWERVLEAKNALDAVDPTDRLQRGAWRLAQTRLFKAMYAYLKR